jgi:translation elongation factor EF-4
VEFDWEFPLAEIILDFFDKLKTVSRGYASLDYEMLELSPSKLVRLDMLINGDPIDAFSVIIARRQGVRVGAQDRRQAQGADSAAAVRGGDPGGDRHRRSSRARR